MERRHSLLLGVLAVASIPVGSATAQAQSLRPHILFIFDTSISMLENTSGTSVAEGTNICGSGTTGSRLYGLKSGIRAALAQVGTDEANFGLMSFGMQIAPNAMPSNWCGQNPTGHYMPTPAGTAAVPNRVASTLHTTTSYPIGCLMSTNTTEQTFGAWFTNGATDFFRVGVTTAAVGAVPTAANFDPADGNIPAIYRWIDNVELPTTAGTVTDPELHANAATPLGRSFFYARMYYDNLVKAKDGTGKLIDPKGSCRQNLVIMVTDGAETCDDGTAPDATFVACATPGNCPTGCTGGGNYNPFHPVAQACLLAKSGIKAYIITDTTTGAANDTIAAAGGTGAAIRVTLNDATAAKSAILGIIAATVPPAETCNGKDDNCNGLIDEGVSNMCPVSNNAGDPDNLLGTAAKHCAVETCNCLDDNCNGLIDEGLPPNACGQGCGCAVPKEICNGLDDNCDGDIDEGFNVGMACDNGLKGACHRTGITACNAAGTGTFCDAPVVGASQEICNLIDDDCNGMTDDGPLPGVGVACGTALGNCKAGVTACINGQIVCSTTSMPKDEICNGEDDNCDGVVDNGVFPQTGMTCLCPGLIQAQVDVHGQCQAGHMVCRGMRGFVCEGCVLPSPEICDGKDNDCDGIPDLNATCPSGLGCKDGQCAVKCRPGEVPCSGTYKCVNDFCVPAMCGGISCPTDTRCDEATGKCVDLCATLTCATPKICQHGSCVDCNTTGCDPGSLCIAGRCQVDKCTGVTCASNEYCANGACVKLCTQDMCPANQRCVAGQCMDDSCTNVGCGDNQFCDQSTAQCTTDPCSAKQCAKGERCVKTTGMCLPDPCLTTQCPSPCWQCTTTPEGTATCVVSGDCREIVTKVGTKSGGGCSCSVDAGPAAWPGVFALLLGLAGAIGARRRARR